MSAGDHLGLTQLQECLHVKESPTSGRVVMLKTERREVPGSNRGRACRPSGSEFSVVFSETCVNMGK